MQCPYCGRDSRVLDSRGAADVVRRRRECLECGRRFTTYERLANPEIKVVKRDGRQEAFDRGKLTRIVERVTRNRPVSRKACADLARGLEAELVDSGVQMVSSGQVTDRLLARLGELDKIAAQRFASNYQHEDGVVRTGAGGPPKQLPLPLPLPLLREVAPEAMTGEPPRSEDPPPPRRARARRS